MLLLVLVLNVCAKSISTNSAPPPGFSDIPTVMHLDSVCICISQDLWPVPFCFHSLNTVGVLGKELSKKYPTLPLISIHLYLKKELSLCSIPPQSILNLNVGTSAASEHCPLTKLNYISLNSWFLSQKYDSSLWTLKFLIRVLHFLFFLGIFSYLHGLIRTYTFIYFWDKFLPTLFFM